MKPRVSQSLFYLIIFAIALLSSIACSRKMNNSIAATSTFASSTRIITEVNSATMSSTQSHSTDTPLSTQTYTTSPLVSATTIPKLTVVTNSTPTPTANPAATDGLLGWPLFMEYDYDGIAYLTDALTGETRVLENISVTSNNLLDWTRQGCGFYLETGEHDIVEADLHGKLRLVFDFKNIRYDGQGEVLDYTINLSPSEKWAAFWVGDGDRTCRPEIPSEACYRYDRENLWVISADGSEGPYQISQGGSAWEARWSRDSSRVAYLDRDSNGIFQIYVAKYDGSQRTQLTSFIANNSMPYPSAWSPNNKYIVALYGPFGYMDTQLVIDIESKKTTFLMKDRTLNWWWEGNNSIAWWGDKTISWYDPADGSLVKTKDISFEVDGVFYLGSNNVFIVYAGKHRDFFICNLDSETITLLSNYKPRKDIDGYRIAPIAFPGDANCK